MCYLTLFDVTEWIISILSTLLELNNEVFLQARSFLQSGILWPIVDKALGNNYNVESMWKVAKTAVMSIEPYSVHRPTMTEVVCQIREAIEMENGQL
jgi:hypothetical protein